MGTRVGQERRGDRVITPWGQVSKESDRDLHGKNEFFKAGAKGC